MALLRTGINSIDKTKICSNSVFVLNRYGRLLVKDGFKEKGQGRLMSTYQQKLSPGG